MSPSLSRRKFFGLFGGAAAAAVVPKPLLALAAPEVAAITPPVMSVSVISAGSGYTNPPVLVGPAYYQYVQSVGRTPKIGEAVFWANEDQFRVSTNPYAGGRNGQACTYRRLAGIAISELKPAHYGYIKLADGFRIERSA